MNRRIQPCTGLRLSCVSSVGARGFRTVRPYELRGDPAQAWAAVCDAAASLPRATVVERNADYLHVVVRSAVFGFKDDVEFERVGDRRVDVRSAARTGLWDGFVNPRRIRDLRTQLADSGFIEP